MLTLSGVMRRHRGIILVQVRCDHVLHRFGSGLGVLADVPGSAQPAESHSPPEAVSFPAGNVVPVAAGLLPGAIWCGKRA